MLKLWGDKIKIENDHNMDCIKCRLQNITKDNVINFVV